MQQVRVGSTVSSGGGKCLMFLFVPQKAAQPGQRTLLRWTEMKGEASGVSRGSEVQDSDPGSVSHHKQQLSEGCHELHCEPQGLPI